MLQTDDNDTSLETGAADSTAQVSQEPVETNVPPQRPQSREVKQDVIGTDERNFFEKETESKK